MNIPDSVLFSTFVTISIFFLGFFIKERLQIYSDNKKLKNAADYLTTCLSKILSSLSDQMEEMKPNLNTADTGLSPYFISPYLDPKNILDREETFYKIIFDRKKGTDEEKNKIFNTVIINCNALSSVVNDLNKMYDDLTNRRYDHCMKIDSIGHEIFLKITEIDLKLEKKPAEDKIILYYDKIKSKNRKEYFKQIQNLENYIIETKASELSSLLILISSYIKEFLHYEYSLNNFNNKIINYKQHLVEINIQLKEGLGNFNQLEFKHHFRR